MSPAGRARRCSSSGSEAIGSAPAIAVLACIHRLPKPALGLAEEPLRAAGLELDERDLRSGDPLARIEEIDGPLSLGGEQSVRELERYPYFRGEVELIAEAVERRLPVFGICLGGQLLAASQGARIGRLPRRSIDWPLVRRRPAFEGDRLWGRFPRPFLRCTGMRTSSRSPTAPPSCSRDRASAVRRSG